MRERTAQTLAAAVREFIRSGRPVSSFELTKRGLLGVSPATIRAELGWLTHEGYLSQLHTSGGRVPTDRGYELFVEQVLASLLGEESRTLPGQAGSRDLALEFLEGEQREFVRNASRRLHLLSVGYAPESGSLYQSGLDDLFERLEVDDRRELAEIARDIERLGERCARWSARLLATEESPRVFIGKKSPLTTSGHLAVIMDEYQDEDGGQFFFLAVGPKRMDYQRNLSFFKALHDSVCQ